MTYDQRILCDKVFRDKECSDVKMMCTDAMAAQSWVRVSKCSEFLVKYDNKTDDEIEINEVVGGIVLTNESNTENDSDYLTDASLVLEENEAIVVGDKSITSHTTM
jgi:hypothetical protein